MEQVRKTLPKWYGSVLTDLRRLSKTYDQSRFSNCLFRKAKAQSRGILRAIGSTAFVL
jgi:hypothetical protein